MLLFSQRLKLQSLYLQWCKRNNVADTPFSVITFLHSNSLIDDEAANRYLEEHKDEVQMS
jgi:hypothetical protein